MAQPGGNYPGAPQPWATGPKVRFEVIGEAWQLFQKQMGVWIAAELIFVLIMVGCEILSFSGGMFSAMLGKGGGGLLMLFELVLMFVMMVVEWFFMAGLMRLAIKQVRGETIEFKDMFAVLDVLPTIIGAAILVGLASLAGYLCLIIPGLIIASLLVLTYPLIIDQRLGVTEAMSRSWNALKGEWLMATLFVFVIGLLAEAGAIACGVGVLFTIPLAFLSVALMYRDFFLNTANPASPYGTYPVAPTGGYTPPLYGSDVPQPPGGYATPYGSDVAPPAGGYAPPPAPPTETYTAPPPPQPTTDVYAAPPPPVTSTTPIVSEEPPLAQTQPTMQEEPVASEPYVSQEPAGAEPPAPTSEEASAEEPPHP